MPTRCSKDDTRNVRSHADDTLEILREAGELAGAAPGNAEAVGVDALIAYTVLNDLGKVKSVVAKINDELQRHGEAAEIDHDKILRIALERYPEVAPSFARLPEPLQKVFVASLSADFNFGQLLQAENVPASLLGLVGMEQRALDFYMLHVLFDIAGAAGHVRHDGSVVMTESTYRGFEIGWEAVRELTRGASASEVYDAFLTNKVAPLGIDASTKQGRAIGRIACMLRMSSTAEADGLKKAFAELPRAERAILEKELNQTGIGDGFATLLYYAPATLANAKKALADAGEEDASGKAFAIGLKAFARAFQLARIELKKRPGDGVYSLNVAELAAAAARDPKSLDTMEFRIERVGNDGRLVVEPKAFVEASAHPRLDTLGALPGKRVVPVGIGGGSDVVQAAILGKMLRESGKDVPAVISVRTAITSSQGASGAVGERRTVENAEEVLPGIFRISPTSTGSGRFVENVPAAELPVYLVIDHIDGTLTARMSALLSRIGGVDTALAVDTGGDALYPSAASTEEAHATPDQDLRVLRAMADLSMTVVSAEIGTGIDAPDNAAAVLARAGARYYTPSTKDRQLIGDTYAAWDFTGDNPARYGKTPFGWQQALGGARGYTSIALPERVLTDGANPWDPFVAIGPATEGIFFMDARQHLAAIDR